MAIRRGFLLIRAQFVLHSAYSFPIRNWFLNFRAACSNVILLFVMNSCAIPAELSRFSRIFVTKSYLNRDWLVHHHDWRFFFKETSRIPPESIKNQFVAIRAIRGQCGIGVLDIPCRNTKRKACLRKPIYSITHVTLSGIYYCPTSQEWQWRHVLFKKSSGSYNW